MSSGPPAANASNLGTSTATVTPDGLPEHIEGRVLFQGVRVHGLPPVYIGLPPVRIVVPKYYCVLRVGDADEPLWKSKDVAQDGFVVKWGDDIQFSVPVTVQLTFEVYLAHPVGQDQQVLRFVQTIQSLLRTCTDAFYSPAFFDILTHQGSQVRLTVYVTELERTVPRTDLDRVVARAGQEFSTMDRAPRIQQDSEGAAATPSAGRPGIGDRLLDALIGKLEALRLSADPHTPTGGWARTAGHVLSASRRAYELTERQTEFDDQMDKLFRKMNAVYQTIQESTTLDGHHEVIDRIIKQTIECGYLVSEYAREKDFRVRRTRYALIDWGHIITQYSTAFDGLLHDFTSISSLRTEVSVVRVLQNLETMESADVLKELPYASHARYELGRRCLAHTREALLEDIIDWINGSAPNAPRMYFLHGPAGTGKSTIAHSIARHFDECKRLGSAFMISSAYRHRISDILPTIARDLADLDPRINSALCREIRGRRSDRSISDLSEQLNLYILKPCNDLNFAGPIVIVLDGVDELGSPKDRQAFLSVLKANANDLPDKFRILVTGRPEVDLMEAFGEIGDTCRIEPMPTVASDPTLMSDLLTYVSCRLMDPRGMLLPGLPDNCCEKIAQKSEGLFQWASIACTIIETRCIGESTRTRYTRLMEADFSTLDDLYTKILDQILRDNMKVLDSFKAIMGFLLTAVEPLCMQSIGNLLSGLEPEESLDVYAFLPFLGSLLCGVAPDDMALVRPLHSSFVDFLQNPARAGHYYIGSSGHHERLVCSSLHLLTRTLHFNMGGFKSSYRLNRDVDSCDPLRSNLGHELLYACKHWGYHLSMCRKGFESTVAGSVRRLLMENLLFWLDAASIGEVIAYIPGCLTAAFDRLQNIGDDVLSMAEDGIRFIRTFMRPIMDSAAHVYISALIWAPANTAVAKTYWTKYWHAARITSGMVNSWSSLESTVHGHTGRILCVAFLPDGTRVISGSTDRSIRLWDAETGHAIGSPFEGHTDDVNSVAISADGTRIASGSSDNTVRVWDTETGHAIGSPLEGHTDDVNSVAISPDGTRIASGSSDNTVRVWDAQTGRAIGAPLVGHTDDVNSVAISPDGKRIASGSSDNTIRMWGAQAEHAIGEPLVGHVSGVTSVAFSPDGMRLVSGSHDNTLRMWDVQTGHTIGDLLAAHVSGVTSVAFSPDGMRLVSGSHDNSVRIWDAATRFVIGLPFKDHESGVTSVAFSPDGRRIVSGSYDDTIRLWDANTGHALGPLLDAHEDVVTCAVFSPDGNRTVSGSSDNTLRLWNAKTGYAVSLPLEGHQGWVTAVAFSPDGKRIVSTSQDNTVQIWNTTTGHSTGPRIEGHEDGVTSVAFSPSGKRLVTGSYDHTVRTWDVETRRAIGLPLIGHTDTVTSVAWSRDGKQILSASHDSTIRVWDAENGHAIGVPMIGSLGAISAVAFSSAEMRAVSGSYNKTIQIWDIETGHTIGAPLEGHEDAVTAVAFSPDGRHIISGSWDKTIRIWDAATGSAIGQPLEGHAESITSVAYSADGRWIVSGSADCTIRIWESEMVHNTAPFSLSPELAEQLAQAYEADETEDVRITFDPRTGWVKANETDHLLWIPPGKTMQHLYHNALRMILPREELITVDLSRFKHGKRWTECCLPEP